MWSTGKTGCHTEKYALTSELMSQTTILVSSRTSFDLRGKSYLGNEVRNVNPKESPVIKRRSRKRVGECTTRSKSEIKDKLTAIFVGDLFLSQIYYTIAFIMSLIVIEIRSFPLKIFKQFYDIKI